MPSDYEAISRLLFTYAERIDAGDFAGVGQLLRHAELTFEGYDHTISGPDAIEALYQATTRRYDDDGTPKSKHVMTNVIVDVEPNGVVATSRSYFTVLQAVPGVMSLQPVVAGRYRDRFGRVDEAWEFTGRHIMVELTGELSHHLLGNTLQ